MTPEELSALITRIVRDAAHAGTITLDEADIPETVTVERPRHREHGDWASNVARPLAKKAHTAPRALATVVADALRENEGIDSVEIAGPGFINIRLAAASAG